MSPPVIAASQCAEPLLARRVPNGQLQPLAVDCHELQLEVHTCIGPSTRSVSRSDTAPHHGARPPDMVDVAHRRAK